MPKYPSEVFGHPVTATDAKAAADRTRHWCPFVDKVCYKQSRLTSIPFGVCSAHVQGDEIALCPRRFLDQSSVFFDIAQHHFKTTHDILVFSEVGLPTVGSFDFVMVKHKPLSSEIEDFVVIEFQTGQTSSTGGLVQGFKDFMAGESVIYKSYRFGLNTYDIWKRTFTQVLNKGIIMESWGRKIYWVVQDQIYRDLETRYNLQTLTLDERDATVFALYDLVQTGNKFELVATRKTSASIDRLFDALRNNRNIPPVEAFFKTLSERIHGQAQISLSLDTPSRSGMPDIKPPTSSGRVRESNDAEDEWEAE